MSFKPKKPEAALPKTLGACADEMYQTRAARLALQKEVAELEKRESILKNHIIDTMPKSDGGAVGKLVRVTIVSKVRAQAKDWEAFWEYVWKNRKKGATALVQRRLSEAAVKEIWDSGKEIPGVESFTTLDLSVNKL